jgi:hypothetical protein
MFYNMRKVGISTEASPSSHSSAYQFMLPPSSAQLAITHVSSWTMVLTRRHIVQSVLLWKDGEDTGPLCGRNADHNGHGSGLPGRTGAYSYLRRDHIIIIQVGRWWKTRLIPFLSLTSHLHAQTLRMQSNSIPLNFNDVHYASCCRCNKQHPLVCVRISDRLVIFLLQPHARLGVCLISVSR